MHIELQQNTQIAGSINYELDVFQWNVPRQTVGDRCVSFLPFVNGSKYYNTG